MNLFLAKFLNIGFKLNAMWEIRRIGNVPKTKRGMLIEGLPGIGNTGKIAVDYIIGQLKAKDIISFYSSHMPNSAFVNKDNLVELPKLNISNFRNIYFLHGDIQPIDEESSHTFANEVLKLCNELHIKEIITLGGIGMPQPPEKPKIYITGNNKNIVNKYSSRETRTRIAGVVGPIFGITGLLVALANKYKIEAVSYLVQSYAHPLHVGIKEAYELLKILDAKLNLNLNLKKFQKDVKKLEKEQKIKIKDLSNIKKEMSYIG